MNPCNTTHSSLVELFQKLEIPPANILLRIAGFVFPRNGYYSILTGGEGVQLYTVEASPGFES